MIRSTFFIWLLLLALVGCDSAEVAAPRPQVPFSMSAGFVGEIVASGLNLPTSLAFAPDGSGRLFVNELQTGRIWIFEDGERLPEPFAEVETNSSGGFPVQGEVGLLGLAFDPDYAQNRFVYATYARRVGDEIEGRVVRFTDVANRGQDMTVLLDGVPSAEGHQIESLAFGPDGKLYVSTGDAYQSEDAQDPAALNGKILRMNPDGSIPGDNPFPGTYTYALGLRNSFDLAFRPNGDLVSADNGPSQSDELNVVLRGGNLGWPQHLGYSGGGTSDQPIHVWQEIVSPTGMLFYEGTQFPAAYRGMLFIVFFGDTFSAGPSDRAKRIQVVDLEGNGIETTPVFEEFVVYTGAGQGNPLDVTEGPDGSLYFTDIFLGRIYRIRYEG